MVIWKHSPRLKDDLLDLHSISRISYFPTVYLLGLLIVWVKIGLGRHLRKLRWSIMGEVRLRLGWRQ